MYLVVQGWTDEFYRPLLMTLDNVCTLERASVMLDARCQWWYCTADTNHYHTKTLWKTIDAADINIKRYVRNF